MLQFRIKIGNEKPVSTLLLRIGIYRRHLVIFKETNSSYKVREILWVYAPLRVEATGSRFPHRLLVNLLRGQHYRAGQNKLLIIMP